ncbi:hypothetical protein ACFYSJ_32665 [Streptomyces sp. NPDC005248]|uniref:hypothetical protein n=1 Tax=unclassified Streptomyces TaxID=2593676 RepID=UPI0033B265F8
MVGSSVVALIERPAAKRAVHALDGQVESGRTAAWHEARLHLLVSSELRAAEG